MLIVYFTTKLINDTTLTWIKLIQHRVVRKIEVFIGDEKKNKGFPTKYLVRFSPIVAPLC